MSKLTTIVLAPAILSTASLGALAAKSHSDEKAAMAAATVSLAQAITIAEQHTNGAAIEADAEHGSQKGLVYDIKVLSQGKRMKVTVDAVTGKVLAKHAKHAKHTRHDDHDKHDNHDEQDRYNANGLSKRDANNSDSKQ
ncbi:MAG: PepSY domain-containing protein [Burkholderiaceae bacterium]